MARASRSQRVSCTNRILPSGRRTGSVFAPVKIPVGLAASLTMRSGGWRGSTSFATVPGEFRKALTTQHPAVLEEGEDGIAFDPLD